MSKPTFELFNYGLRPAKNMQRKMLCEAMSRLSRIAALSTYRYLGLGSIGFHDFILFHQKLGIEDMHSIEGYANSPEKEARIEFNIPYSCIKMHWKLSHEVLPTLKWPKRCVIWLDYEGPLDTAILGDITQVVASAKSGSLLVFTVNATPAPVEGNTDIGEKRLEQLRQRVGRGRVPGAISGTDLAKWGLAKVTRQIMHDHILKTLGDRNAPLESATRLTYQQLFNFNYADGAKMLTVGGLLLNRQDGKKLSSKHFKDLDFYREGEDPYIIETPILTLREIRYLDSRLPRIAPDCRGPRWLPEEDRRRYGKVYRYFPSFTEVEV